MKKPPERGARRLHRVIRATRAPFASLLVAQIALAQVPEKGPEALPDDWYHVELLVFARDDATSVGAERWEPLPVLSYPERYRYLVDPERADRRVAESLAFASAIDDLGIQRITIPAPVEPVDAVARPDARIDEPYEAPDPNMPALLGPDGDAQPGADKTPGETADDARMAGGSQRGDDAADEGESTNEEALPRELLALPEQLLPDADLAFRGEARSLRRRGERVLFHGHWWSRLPEGTETLPLVLDRAADIDASAWPALQGSVHVYRSRFLHIDVDLWLNTMASYLPAGWQIDPPPLPAPSLLSATLAGEALDPWTPLPQDPLDRADSTSPSPSVDGPAPIAAAPPGGPGDPDERHGRRDPSRDEASVPEEQGLAAAYPWRHAITHRQSRRMRSGETHYLDHPVIGVIVRLRPVSDDLLPFVAEGTEEELAFRERHGLPVKYLPLRDEESD